MIAPTFSVIKGELWINGNKILLPSTVTQVEFIHNLFVVLMEPSPQFSSNRNVYGIDGKGNTEWQISEAPHGNTTHPFIRLSQDGTGKLVAENWTGVNYYVDLGNGNIQPQSFSRF